MPVDSKLQLRWTHASRCISRETQDLWRNAAGKGEMLPWRFPQASFQEMTQHKNGGKLKAAWCVACRMVPPQEAAARNRSELKARRNSVKNEITGLRGDSRNIKIGRIKIFRCDMFFKNREMVTLESGPQCGR